MDDILKVALLALLEGVTEFLPVSSTGHLIVGAALLEFDAMGAVFEIFIQFGAVVAVVAFYGRSLLRQAFAAGGQAPVERFWVVIALGSLPAAVVGVAFAPHIESLFFTPTVVALALIGGGIAFLAVERSPRLRHANAKDSNALSSISPKQALLVGMAQTTALIPGVSRSGASILGGMLAGLERRQATEFSFVLAIPLLGGATLYKLATSLSLLRVSDIALLLLGTALAGVFAWLAMGWLLEYVSRRSFVVFGWYRIAAGCLILLGVSNGFFG